MSAAADLQGTGVAGVDSYFWSAFLFPKDTPDAIVQRLVDASNQTLNLPRPWSNCAGPASSRSPRIAGRRPISETSR